MSENQEDNSKFDEEVLRQQEAIRQSGVINMFDKRGVKRHANEMGFNELVVFIKDASASEYTEMASKAAEKHRR